MRISLNFNCHVINHGRHYYLFLFESLFIWESSVCSLHHAGRCTLFSIIKFLYNPHINLWTTLRKNLILFLKQKLLNYLFLLLNSTCNWQKLRTYFMGVCNLVLQATNCVPDFNSACDGMHFLHGMFGCMFSLFKIKWEKDSTCCFVD